MTSLQHHPPSTHHLDPHHPFDLAPYKDSFFLAQTEVSRLLANVGDYIFMQRIKAIIVPHVIEQTLGQSLEICEYNEPASDKQAFYLIEGDETQEALTVQVDSYASDYMKKRAPPPQPTAEESQEEQQQNDGNSGARKMRKAVNKMRLSLVHPKRDSVLTKGESKRASQIASQLNAEIIAQEDKNAPLKPGDMYDVVKEAMDPEDERRENVARRKYQVNKLFESQTGAAPKTAKQKDTPDEVDTRAQFYGVEGGLPTVNPIRGPALPFIKQTQYQVNPGQERSGSRGGSQNLINMLKARKRNSQSTIVSEKRGSTMSISQAGGSKQRHDEDMVVFSPIEEALKAGLFFDPQAKTKIVNKPIYSNNPLQQMNATMAVNIWENEEVTKAGEPYFTGNSMTRAQFEMLKMQGMSNYGNSKKPETRNRSRLNDYNDIMAGNSITSHEVSIGKTGTARKPSRVSIMSPGDRQNNNFSQLTGASAKNKHHLRNSVQIGSSEGLNEMLQSQHDVKFLMNMTFMNETGTMQTELNTTSLLPPQSLFKSTLRSPKSGLDNSLLMSPTVNKGMKLPPMELTSPKTNLAIPSSMRSSFNGGTGLLMSRLSKEMRHRNRGSEFIDENHSRRILGIGGPMKARVM
ncbi:hypothetical protein FGO68_gene15567 [Halteria grandinella]|uniref:Uncharacterized protein n=1 Tax=Halteria grandinella TaxID=5974 RepID=A0A8J8T740_HALGN|nr:hypothetical protein FGO68_gene15567 [Halteria grandinella]